jgi:serine/threonine protein kinase
MSALHVLPDGVTFARDYRIVRPLAEGGMSAVYVAEQRSSGKLRALKVLSSELLRDAESRVQFAQEARIGARIHSGHVAEVIAAGIDEATDLPWIAMELLEGEDLTELVERRGALPLHEVREILAQLGDALAAAHDAGVIHRDLKPRNVFVARSQLRGMPYVVKVLDFGISKCLDQSATSVGITRQLGSPLFMAPEQARSGARLRRSTDVWPLGLLAYFLLTGRYYWRSVTDAGVNLNALMLEIAADPIEAPSLRAASQGLGALPEGFDAWFARCVQRDPAERFQHAREALEALRLVLDRGMRSFADGSDPTTIKPLRAPSGPRLDEALDDDVTEPAQAHPARVPAPVMPVSALPVAALPVVPPPVVAAQAVAAPAMAAPVMAAPVMAAPRHDEVWLAPSPGVEGAPPPWRVAQRAVATWWARLSPRDRVAAGSVTALLAVMAMLLVGGGGTAAEAPAGGGQVELRFTGLRPGARVVVAGVPFYSDVAFAARSETPLTVRVESPGESPQAFTVVPDRDQRVAVPTVVARVLPVAAPLQTAAGIPSVGVVQSVVMPEDVPVVAPSPTPAPRSTATPRSAPRAGTGRLVVGSDPPRCAVRVDGRPVGNTPVFLNAVAAGERRVICLRPGHLPLLRTVRVERGAEREVFFPAP